MIQEESQKIQVQDYVIDLNKLLGRGQYGSVFQASHPVHKKICAKILNTAQIDSKLLNREMNIVSGLKGIDNENLVKVYDIIIMEEKQEIYIIMEQCEGGDLKNDIQKRMQLKNHYTIDEIMNILRQLINGYSTLYDKKIIHRDLKPANILIENGRVMITDFGMGRLIEDTNRRLPYTRVGTPAYASPQLYLEPNYSSKSDVYSLGVIMYQLTYLQLPFRGTNQKELMNFLKNLKIQPFKCEELPNFYNTQDQAKAYEIVTLIEKMLLYSEDQRISWEELIKTYVDRSKIVNQIQIKSFSNISNGSIEDSIFELKQQQQKQKFDPTIFKQIYHHSGEITKAQRINHIIQILISKAKLAQQVQDAIVSFVEDHLPYFQTLNLHLLHTSITGYYCKILENAYGFAYNYPTLIFNQMRKDYDIQAISAAMKQFSDDESQDQKKLKEQTQMLMNIAIESFNQYINTIAKMAKEQDVSQYQKFFQLIRVAGNTEFNIYLKWFIYFYNKLLKPYLNVQNQQNMNFNQIKTLALILKFIRVDEEFPYQKYLEQIPQDIFLKENPSQQKLMEIIKKYSKWSQ